MNVTSKCKLIIVGFLGILRMYLLRDLKITVLIST